ncbi:MAG: sn-glycerol-3-phosphate ABC transporter ATP-binding protein UgpC [Bacteroidota bacterium]
MANVELKKLRKVYPKDVVAIKDANLEIADREFVVLVGPSGCGKSTLLRMIAGLEEISDGDLLIDGKRVNDLSPKDRDIAMVFQNYALYPHMTVFDNMAFGLKLRKFPKAEIQSRVNEAAAILGLTELLNRRPKEMSGGQRQRVAIGRAIVRKPKVFLFDEPLSHLDAKLRVQMRSEIKKLHQKLQATMVYVTHDQVEAMTMGDKIVVLNKGYVQQVDTPMNLYNNPANKFVGSFIGSPAMNFVDGDLQKSGNGWTFNGHGFAIDFPASVTDKLPEQQSNLILGFRPESIYDTTEEKDKSLSVPFNISIEVTEPIGAETFNYFSLGNTTTCMRTHSGKIYHPGEQVQVGLDLNRLYFFDRETENRIRV